MSPSLGRLFQSQLRPLPFPDADVAAADALLRAAVASAREQWPTLSLSDEAMVGALAQRFRAAGSVEPLEGLALADLILAAACCEGDPRALRIFEEQVLPRARKAVQRLNRDGDFVDEVLQRVRERLLLRDGRAAPRLLQYSGRGPLVLWLRAAAVRTGINLFRQQGGGKLADEPPSPELPADGPGPESGAFKRQLRGTFKQAFQAALDSLSPEERELLRLSALEGLSIDKLHERLGQHRSTMSRQLAKIREILFSRTRRQLIQQLGLVSRSEVRQVATFVGSQLDLSLRRMLDRE